MHGTAALTLVLILVGVIVRSTGSGLGCGTAGGWHDWPLCHGRLIPPASLESIIEFSHRAFAALVSLSLVVASVWTIRSPALRRRLGGGVGLAVGLLVLQIALGALTVRVLEDGEINPAFVVAHLATAFSFFATLVVVGMRAIRIGKGEPEAPVFSPAQRLYVLIAASAILFQAIIGGLVANLGASMACPEFPTCAGGVLIPTLTGPMGLQIVHRLGAVTVSLLILGLPFMVGKVPGAPRRMALVALGLVLFQFALGVATVLLGLPLFVRALHHVMAYALFGTAVGIGYVVLRGPVGVGDPDRVGRTSRAAVR